MAPQGIDLQKRSDELDVIKGLGIMAVVYGHAMGPFAHIVFLYHLALFFFVSGCLYKESYARQPFLLVKRRIRSLYVPFVGFGLFFGILHNILFKVNLYTDRLSSQYNQVSYLNSSREYLLNLLQIASFAKVEQLLAPMWFLPVLFIVQLLVVVPDSLIAKFAPRQRGILLSAVVAALFTLGYLYYPEKNAVLRPVSIAMVVAGIFYFGHLFRQHGGDVAIKPQYALLSFLLLVVASRYGSIDTGGHVFVSPHFYIACSLSGIYLHLFLARSVPEGSLLKRFLVHVGRNTITILALHFLAFRAVNFLQVMIHDLPAYMTGQHPKIPTTGAWWLVYFVAGILLPLAVRAAYDRLRRMGEGSGPHPAAA